MDEEPRALATIEHIDEILPHDNADALELAIIRGWQVVTKIGEFSPGDLVVFFEIDTMLDVADPRFAFLAPRGVRTDVRDGFQGHVVKTVRLRGELSQGLALPVGMFVAELGEEVHGGRDVTETLGLRKWDPPLAASLSGKAKGTRPGWVPKTDAKRVQNVNLAYLPHGQYVASEKIDGTSTSYFVDFDEPDMRLRAASRNLELYPAGQSQWLVAEQVDMFDRIEALRDRFAATRVVVQGELAGPGIQKNPLQLPELRFFVFRVLADGADVLTGGWGLQLGDLAAPVLDVPLPTDRAGALEAADALDSRVSPGRRPEGIVWRYEGPDTVQYRTIKAVSNRYLLKQSD